MFSTKKVRNKGWNVHQSLKSRIQVTSIREVLQTSSRSVILNWSHGLKNGSPFDGGATYGCHRDAALATVWSGAQVCMSLSCDKFRVYDWRRSLTLIMCRQIKATRHHHRRRHQCHEGAAIAARAAEAKTFGLPCDQLPRQHLTPLPRPQLSLFRLWNCHPMAF